MFAPLPAKTVFEAQARNRRDTVLLFSLLAFLYVIFFNLIAFALFGDIGHVFLGIMGRGFGILSLMGWVSVAAVAVAVLHFLVARAKTLETILASFGAKPADPSDEYHRRFTNLVAEAEAATGIRPIRAVLIPSTGSNAFSVSDAVGHAAIGATEGLLTRLERNEMAAVVAHEASHLVNGDSRLLTTAGSLFGILGTVQSSLGSGGVPTNEWEFQRGSYRRRRSGGGGGRLVLAWLVAGVGYLLTKAVCMALSRRREFMADEHAVQICKDPLALAQALSKIAGKYRGGGGDVNEAYAPLFIMDPNISRLDEERNLISNLFSTHPPIRERLECLMGYARMNMGIFREKVERDARREEEAMREPVVSSAKEEALFYANRDGEWFGPSTPQQLLAAGLLGPQAWICPVGSRDVVSASSVPEILPLIQGQTSAAVAKETCPRCRMPLLPRTYEGLSIQQCPFCKGHLLKAGYMERIIARREERFDPAEVRKAREWRDSQRGMLKDACGLPAVRCPRCSLPMSKMFQSLVTRVVVDRCTGPDCGAVWCDGGELETLQMLAESDSVAAGF